MSSYSELPALLGGAPLNSNGPPEWPFPDEHILEALREAHQNGSWGKYHGGNVDRLEKELCDYHQVEFALTCASGTFAVETALRGLRVGQGDEVILAAYDYPGNFHCIHVVGALPVLVDVDPRNWNLNVTKIEGAISPKTRAVIVSHLHGGIVPMRELMDIAAAHELAVIEDAAQNPGAIVQGKKAGAWGDVGVLSFGGSKLLTASRGGAILTNRADVHQRMRVALIRGNHICPMSELQAAVLPPQLKRLDERNQQRNANVHHLKDMIADVPGLRMFVNQCSENFAAYYKLGFQYSSDEFGLPRELFIAALRAEGVAMDDGFRGLHAGRSERRFRRGSELTEADRAHEGAVILHHPVLLQSKEYVENVAKAIDRIYSHRERLVAELRS